MRLPIVDTRTIPTEVDYLHVWRVGQTAPSRRLEVRRVEDGHAAWLTHPDHDDAHMALDAEFAGELASAAQLLAGRDPAVFGSRDADDWAWTIELGWSGARHEYRIAHEPAEDALRAIVRRMSVLGEHPLELHVRGAAEEVDG